MAITKEGKQLMALENEIFQHIEQHGWTKMDIGISVMYFEQTHGEEAMRGLRGFLRWAAQHNLGNGPISVVLGHDLKGCQDKLMLPRSFGYAKYA